MMPPEESGSGWIRAFVALPLPGGIKERLTLFVGKLRRRLGAPAFRWAQPAQIHLTLKFLGQIPAETRPALEAALRQAGVGVAPLRLSAAGLGFFPEERKPRVCWIGVEGDVDSLRDLQEKVDRLCTPWVPREEKPFTPHLTLARIKPPAVGVAAAVAGLPEDCRAVRLGEWEAREMELMESELLPQGARHTRLAGIPLLGGGRAG